MSSYSQYGVVPPPINTNNTGNSPKLNGLPPPSPQTANNVNIDAAKIFVGGLSWQTTEETLRYHFEQYGDVLSVEIMKDRNTGDPRGFAFVVFRSDDTVQLILNEKPHEIDRKIVDVKRAQARGFAPPSIHPNHQQSGVSFGTNSNHNSNTSNSNPNSNFNTSSSGNNSSNKNPNVEVNKVFVGGLPLQFTKDDLTQHLSAYGTVVDSIVMMDPIHRQRSRGFGFVTFASSDHAQECIKHQPLNMAGKMVEVKLAMPRGGGGGSGAGDNNNNSGNHQGNSLHSQNNSNSSTSNQTSSVLNSSVLNSTQLPPPPPPKGKYAGLAASYGKNGWRAGYGTNAFGKMGWNIIGWEDYNVTSNSKNSAKDEEDYGEGADGFSFDFLKKQEKRTHRGYEGERKSKRVKY